MKNLLFAPKIQMLGFFAVILLCLLCSTINNAKQRIPIATATGFDCKWHATTCPGGKYLEVCTRDGNGNACTCGTQTQNC